MSYFPLPSKPVKPKIGKFLYCKKVIPYYLLPKEHSLMYGWTWGESNPRPNSLSWDTLRFHC